MDNTKIPATSISNYNQSQPDSTIPGTSIAFTAGVYTPFHDEKQCPCKSVELSYSGTAGSLKVHMLKDPDDVFYTFHLEPGQERGLVFDKIIESGTTVNKDHLTLFPALFY